MQQSGWIKKWINNTRQLMLGERTSQIYGQDQIVQSGNYSFSSIRVMAIDEKNDYHDSN